MKDMGEQLEDMSSELSKLRVENNSLKNRNTILEKVLALRDEHIRMLQDEQQVRRRLAPWQCKPAAASSSVHRHDAAVVCETASMPGWQNVSHSHRTPRASHLPCPAGV